MLTLDQLDIQIPDPEISMAPDAESALGTRPNTALTNGSRL